MRAMMTAQGATQPFARFRRRAWTRGVFAACAAGAVAAAAVADPAAPEAPPPDIAAFTASRLSAPPKLDGTIDPKEWREATAVSGVVGANPVRPLLPRPTTYYLAWDADNIYLACRTWVAPNSKPMIHGREKGAATVFDPGLELHIRPLAEKAAGQTGDSSYKFFINLLGFDGHLLRCSVGQLFQNWYPDFKIAARFTEPGTAPYGGSWWEMESAMSWKDFEMAGPHRAGDQWRMMLAFNQLPGWMQARIPCVGGYFDPAGYCLVTLAENVPAVQVTMDAMPGFAEGTASAVMRVNNASETPRTVGFLARVFDDKGDLVNVSGKETIPPGGAFERAINEKLARTSGKVHYRVTEGDAILFDYAADFAADNEAQLDWFLARKAEKKVSTFEFSSGFNPIRGLAFVQCDVYPLDDPGSVTQMDYRVLQEGHDKALAEGRVTESRMHRFSTYIELPEIAQGKYRIEASLRLADGTILGPKSSTHEKLDEAKAFGEWWDNKLGDPERVIYPFVAMTRQENLVSAWGRAYRINALGLPEQIESQGGALMNAAARIVAVLDGKAHVIPIAGAPEFTEDVDWRKSFKGTAEGAGLRFNASGWIEQDGLVYIELTYAPLGDAPVKVDALRIEFPFDSAQAEGLMAVANGGNFAPLATISIPKKGGEVWNTLKNGRLSTGMTVGSFYPEIWLGNERRGLMWYAENDRGWVPEDDVPAHEVIRQGKDVLLRNNIIGSPFELTEARTVAFSYMASPFKPLPKGWRYALESVNGTFAVPHKKRTDPKTNKEVDGWAWLSPPSTDPAEWGELWASYKPKADAHVKANQHNNPAYARSYLWSFAHTSLPLLSYGARSGDARVNGYFGAEWNGNPLNDSQRDYWIYLAHRAFGEGGLRTIYWDIFFNDLVGDNLSGQAYLLPDGRSQRGYAGWNARRFFQRLYALQHDHGLAPGGIMTHASNNYLLIAAGWIDAILDGEFHEITAGSTFDWVDGYPIDRMRFLSTPATWGVGISWMHHIGGTGRQDFPGAHLIRRSFQDYVKMFDSWRGPDHGAMPDSLLQFGLNDGAVEYVPFWRTASLARVNHKDVLVSLWRMPGRVVVGVFNYNGKDTIADCAVDLDLKALGLAGKLVNGSLLEGENHHTFQSKGRLTVSKLLPHTGRFYGVRAVDRGALEGFHAQYVPLARAAFPGQGTDDLTVPDGVLLHDMVRPETRFFPPGKLDKVAADGEGAQVYAWQLPDRVLLGVLNAGDKGRDITLKVDLDALGLAPELPWQEFIRCHGIIGGASLDFGGRKVTLKGVAPGTGRLFVIRRH